MFRQYTYRKNVWLNEKFFHPKNYNATIMASAAASAPRGFSYMSCIICQASDRSVFTREKSETLPNIEKIQFLTFRQIFYKILVRITNQYTKTVFNHAIIMLQTKNAEKRRCPQARIFTFLTRQGAVKPH